MKEVICFNEIHIRDGVEFLREENNYLIFRARNGHEIHVLKENMIWRKPDTK